MSGSNILQVTDLKDLKEIMESCVTVILGFTTPKTPTDLKIFIRKFLKRKAEKFPFITFVYMEVSDSDRQSLNILRADHSMFPKIYHIRNGNTILVQVDAATEETIVESFASAEQFYIDEMREIQKKIKEKSLKNTKKEIDSSDTEISIKVSDKSDNNKLSKKNNKSLKTNISGQKQSQDQIQNQSQDQIQNQSQALIQPQTQNQTQDLTDPSVAKKINLEKLVLLNKKADDLKIDLVKNISQRKKLENKIEKKTIEENKINQEKQNKTLRRGARRS